MGVNLFDTGKVLKHRKLHPPKLSVLRDYNFHLNIVIPSRPIQKKMFPKSEILSNTEVFLYDFLRQSETGKFRQKAIIAPPMQKIFPYVSSSQTLEWSSTYFCGTVRQNISDRRRRFSLHCAKFMEVGFFINREGSSTKFSGTNTQSSSDRKTWYHPRRREHFRYRKSSETQKASSTKVISTQRL